jgi:hypothetical protein
MEQKKEYIVPQMKVMVLDLSVKLLSDSDPDSFDVIIVDRPNP